MRPYIFIFSYFPTFALLYAKEVQLNHITLQSLVLSSARSSSKMKPSFCNTATSFFLVLFVARDVAAAINQPRRRQNDGDLGLSQTGPTTPTVATYKLVTSVNDGLVTSMITPTSTVISTVSLSSGENVGTGAAEFKADGPIETVIDSVTGSHQAASAPATDLTKLPNQSEFEATPSTISILTVRPGTLVPPLSFSAPPEQTPFSAPPVQTPFSAPPAPVGTVSKAFTAGPGRSPSPNSQIGSTPGSITIQSVTPAATSTAAAMNTSKASSGARKFTWSVGLFLSWIAAILPI